MFGLRLSIRFPLYEPGPGVPLPAISCFISRAAFVPKPPVPERFERANVDLVVWAISCAA